MSVSTESAETSVSTSDSDDACPVSPRFCELMAGELPASVGHAARPSDWVGRTLSGCEIRHLVSRTPLCWLFSAVDYEGNERWVALLPPKAAEQKHLRHDFYHQVELLDRCKSPWTPAVIDRAIKDDLPYAVITDPGDYSVARLVRSCGALPAPAAIELVLSVVRAMKDAHVHRIVHAGIDPNSLLLPAKGGLLLGLVERVVEDLGEGAVQLNLAHKVCAPFFSPEQAVGESLDERSDIYIAGALLYFLLAGKPHFQGSRSEVMRMMGQLPPPTLCDQVPGLSRCVDRLLLRCLSPNPAKRPQNADELIAELERLLAGDWESPTRKRMRRPTPPRGLREYVRPAFLKTISLFGGAGLLVASIL